MPKKVWEKVWESRKTVLIVKVQVSNYMNKKSISATTLPLFLVLLLSACNSIGSKTTSMSVIYLTTTVLASALLLGYLLSIQKKNVWFVILFVSVFVINTGYFALSVSDTLHQALWANRISYLGSVFLPLSMIMTIMKVSKLRYKRWLPWVLLAVSIIVFFIAASPGYSDIYYKSVSLETVDGVSVLTKEYGPWHNIYLFYLLGCFVVMVSTIVHAIVKKKIESTAHAIILIMAVLVNILVWLVEQLVKFDFEFLSISYIITELFLIGVYLMIQHQERLIAALEEKITASNTHQSGAQIASSPEFVEKCSFFAEKLSTLTSAERAIYDCYVAGMSTKEVLEAKSIAESTLKYHNRNIYGKLGVTSRKELLACAKAIAAKETK